MDIRNWPLDRIMQLPDCVFGRRWPVICGGVVETETDVYSIVRTAIPDRAVIWEILVSTKTTVSIIAFFEFAWADQLPTTAAQWSRQEKMFPCQGVLDGVDYNIAGGGGVGYHITRLKLPSPAAGLRPAFRLDGASSDAAELCVTFIISSVPTEVPDWLISGAGRSQ